MKIIDLLIMLAEGKEVPKKIKYKDMIFCLEKLSDKDRGYQSTFGTFSDYYCLEYEKILNDKIEIIEE